MGKRTKMSFQRAIPLPSVAFLAAIIALVAGSAPASASVCTLADHIRSANTNTAVGFCPAGTSHDIITIAEDVSLSEPLPPITGTITIEGGGHTISGDKQFRIFDINGGNLTIRNLTLTGGRAQSGGAIRLRGGGKLAIENATLRKNWGRQGGAISSLSAGASITVDNSHFVNNESEQEGGVLYLPGGAVNVSRSSFQNNLSERAWGGVFFVENSRLSATNSTFTGNKSLAGGVLAIRSGTSTLTHVTMVNNESYYLGGDAIFRRGGSVTLRNSIVSNRGEIEDCGGGLTQEAGNLSGDGSCSAGLTDDFLLAFSPDAPDHYQLKDGSPAIDAALAEHCPATDQLGRPRPQGGGCDVGAIESLDAIPSGQSAPAVCPLHDQIVAANTDAAVGNCAAGDGADTIYLIRDLTLSGALPRITSDITIEGNGYTISGDHQFRIFNVVGGKLTLNNATLVGGIAATERGGAIKIDSGGRVDLRNVTLRQNTAKEGGAIWIGSANSALFVDSSSFIRNLANDHGAGGAIDLSKGRISVSNSSFVGNVSTEIGGAISTWSQGAVSVSNSTFSENRADRGGAVFSGGASISLHHVTMVNNRSNARSGGAIYVDDNYAKRVSLRNSIIVSSIDYHHNCAGGALQENRGNLISDDTCGTPALSGAPLLASVTGSPAYYPLQVKSPARDAAIDALCTATDQIGTSRPQGAGCDIGAIESADGSAAQVDSGEAGANCTVTTTHGLNFRDGPSLSGARIGLVPNGATLSPSARTTGWFKVEYQGAEGWISADYVVITGDCG
jgi:uncharacterized protein YgiM (DUF1202 family)